MLSSKTLTLDSSKVCRLCYEVSSFFHGKYRGFKSLQLVSLSRLSKSKQHRNENDRLRLSTCGQVIKPWLLEIQHGKGCHTLAELDVTD